MVYAVLANKALMDILPSLPLHTLGLIPLTVPAVGVGGVGFTTTFTVAAGDVQPEILCVTLIV